MQAFFLKKFAIYFVIIKKKFSLSLTIVMKCIKTRANCKRLNYYSYSSTK